MKAGAATSLLVLFAGTLVSAAEQPIAFKVRSVTESGSSQINFYDPSCSEEESMECVAFILQCEGSAFRVTMPGLMENSLEYARENKASLSIGRFRLKLRALEATIDELNGGWVLAASLDATLPWKELQVAKQLTIDFGVPVAATLTKESRAAAKFLQASCSNKGE